PLREIVGRMRDRRLIEHRVLERREVLVLGCKLRPELDIRRWTAGLLPHLDLPSLIAHHRRKHLLGELLALRRYALGDGPPPDLVPGRRLLRARSHRERCHADLADDL